MTDAENLAVLVRFPPAQTWRIVMINDFEYLQGQFIGPLKAPEV